MKISSSKKDPHNKTTDSISWNDYVSQQHDNIHSHGSISQRSFLRSVVKKKKKKNSLGVNLLLGQISHRYNLLERPDLFIYLFISHKEESKKDPKTTQ